MTQALGRARPATHPQLSSWMGDDLSGPRPYRGSDAANGRTRRLGKTAADYAQIVTGRTWWTLGDSAFSRERRTPYETVNSLPR
jgi:hypothetical protein